MSGLTVGRRRCERLVAYINRVGVGFIFSDYHRLDLWAQQFRDSDCMRNKCFNIFERKLTKYDLFI